MEVSDGAICTYSREHDLLAFQHSASKQLADGISDVCTSHDCDGPFLPFTVPARC
jgi:hypothetical protein